MSTAAPTLQDAYRAWLKIPTDRIPPDHYALLGLDQFEASDEKIRKATLERTKIVRPRCLKYHELGTQLLNEIAAASVCLTDPKSKAQYDERLKTGGVTAAAEMTGDASRNRQRLRELLKAAGRDAILDRAEGEPKTADGKPDPRDPANHKPAARPASTPTDDVDDDTDFDLTLEEEETLTGAGYSDPVLDALLAGDDDDFDIDEEEPTSPFATTPAKTSDLKEMASALALAGVLVVVAVIAIGGFIAWRLAQEEESEPVLTAASLEQSVASEIGKLPSQQFGLPPTPPTADTTSGVSAGGSTSAFPGAAQTDPTAAMPPGPGGVPLPETTKVAPAPVPAVPAPSYEVVERFVGRLMRVECREKAVHLLLRQDEGAWNTLNSSGYAEVGGPTRTWGTPELLEAIVEEPGFEEKILDYRSLEEGLVTFFASGLSPGTTNFNDLLTRPENVVGYENAGDIVEVFGTRFYPETKVTRGGERTQIYVKLQKVSRLGNTLSIAAIGTPRDPAAISSVVHEARNPITKRLRKPSPSRSGLREGPPAAGSPSSVAITGTVVVPLQNEKVLVQTGTLNVPSMQFITLHVPSGLSPSMQTRLLTPGTPITAHGDFNRMYDDTGMPVFEVYAVSADETGALAGSPGPIPVPGAFGPEGAVPMPGFTGRSGDPVPMPGAGQPGLAFDPNGVPPPGEARMPAGFVPGGEAPAPGAGFGEQGGAFGELGGASGKRKPVIGTVPEGGRFYVIQYSYADAFTPRTLDYQVVQGVENRKAVVASLKAQGYKAYAHTTSYKTQEDAEAYIERQYAKQNR